MSRERTEEKGRRKGNPTPKKKDQPGRPGNQPKPNKTDDEDK